MLLGVRMVLLYGYGNNKPVPTNFVNFCEQILTQLQLISPLIFLDYMSYYLCGIRPYLLLDLPFITRQVVL